MLMKALIGGVCAALTVIGAGPARAEATSFQNAVESFY